MVTATKTLMDCNVYRMHTCCSPCLLFICVFETTDDISRAHIDWFRVSIQIIQSFKVKPFGRIARESFRKKQFNHEIQIQFRQRMVKFTWQCWLSKLWNFELDLVNDWSDLSKCKTRFFFSYSFQCDKNNSNNSCRLDDTSKTRRWI